MFRLFAQRPAARVLLVLPALAMASCGGSNTGALLTVPNAVVVADLRNNGVLDVAVATAQIDQTGLNQKPGLLRIILNSTTSPGTFAAAANYASSSSPPSGLAVGDLTGTGTHDLVVANFNAGTLSVFLETSTTSGAYGTARTITLAAGSQPNDVQIADLNGDGLADLIVADNTGKVTYLLQNSASPGNFLPGVSLPITNRGIAVAVGDLNHDGLPDLAVTSFDAGGNNGLVTIYFQDPANHGTFQSTPTTITALGEPSQIRIADVDQDGLQDIVVAMQGAGSNSVLYPAGTSEAASGAMVILQNSSSPGTFGTPVVYPGFQGCISVAVGDLNGDGRPDIAMATPYPQGQGSVVTLMQDPANPGKFLTPTTYPGLGQPVSIAIGDVDKDGLPDLITADATSAVWLKNQSSAHGTFVSQGQIGL